MKRQGECAMEQGVKKSALTLFVLLLSVSPCLSLPVPPEEVVAVPYAEESDSDEKSSFILLSWSAVAGADGYRIYRRVAVTTGVDEQGNPVELDYAEYALARVGFVNSMEPVVSVVVAVLDNDSNDLWAVTTVLDTDDGPVESEPVFFHVQIDRIATGVQGRSWGDVKAHSLSSSKGRRGMTQNEFQTK